MEEKYIARWENEYFPTFVADMYAMAFNEYLGKLSGLSISNLIFLVKNSKTQTHFSEGEIKKGNKWGIDNLSNTEIIKKIIEKTQENNQNNHKLVTEFLKMNLTKFSNEGLIDFLEKYRNSWIKVYGSFCSSQPERTELVEDKIKDYLKKLITDEKKLIGYFAILTKPPKKIEFNPKGNLLFGSFENFIQKHEIDPSINKKEWFVIKEEDKLTSQKRKQIINELNIDKEMLNILHNLHELSIIRFITRLFWMEGLYYYDLFFKEIEKRTDVNFTDLKYYLFDELKKLLFKKKELIKDEIESRKKLYIYFINNGNYEFHTGKQAKQIEEKYIKKELSETEEITGRCANVGFYRGKVKIISFSSDKKFSDEVKKMEYGDVLVTGMTRPQLIETCEKAKAIVTDEGGICSHAAVVSRELNIPCVVGTKIATKVLKDGDIVEVDATNGRVRLSK